MCFVTVASIGFERDSYSVVERDASVTLCISVISPVVACPVSFSFSVIRLTVPGSASMFCTCVHKL